MKQHKGFLKELAGQVNSSHNRFDASLSGAHIYDQKKFFPGYTLLDGMLVDINGRVLNKWKAHYLGMILPNGCYVAQKHYNSQVWGLYSWNDEVIWEKQNMIHHEMLYTSWNTIINFTRETKSIKGEDFEFCVVVEYDMNGSELTRWSTYKNLFWLTQHKNDNEWIRLKTRLFSETEGVEIHKNKNYDYYRMNSFQFLPDTYLGKKDHRFRKGNWLVSFRHHDMVLIIDQDDGKVIWRCASKDIPDELQGQHAPTMLSNGNILIFDNGRRRGWSRVIELDPETKKILWEYRHKEFFTLSGGFAQRFPNGNTLVTECERGRVFEITRDGKVVWEYYHPEQQNESNSAYPESYGSRKWIYRTTRYTPEFVEPFLRNKGKLSFI